MDGIQQIFLDKIGQIQTTPQSSEPDVPYFKSSRYREALKRKAQWYNEEEGILTGYNCTLCKNKGVIMYITEDNTEVCRTCSCMPLRKAAVAMRSSGIDSKILELRTFESYRTEQEWQKRVKDVAERYVQAITEGQSEHWLYISGQTGSGKTHICTAVCKALMQNGKTVRYITWSDLVHKFEQSRFSTIEHDKLIADISGVDVLYIDDLFKTQRNAEIAYEVINLRYIGRKPLIISTEALVSTIAEIDPAIEGRITEMSSGFICQIKPEEGRNWRKK